MKINIPDDYLKYRYFYIYNFVRLKDYFISGMFNNINNCREKILFLTKTDDGFKMNIHSGVVQYIRRNIFSLSNSKLFLPYGNIYFFIDYKIGKIKSKRTLNALMNVLTQQYINLLKNQNIRSTPINNKSLIPININSDKDNNVSLVSVVFFLDFLCVISDNSNVGLNGDDSFLNNIINHIINYMDENKDPFENYDGEVFVNWIYERMERNNMLFDYDVNRMLSNEKGKIVKSSFDFWALSKSKAEIKLYLIEMKKAWSQKKFRDGVKDKKVLNTYISKKASDKLKKISKEENKNMSDILDFLILNSDEIIKEYDFVKLKSKKN